MPQQLKGAQHTFVQAFVCSPGVGIVRAFHDVSSPGKSLADNKIITSTFSHGSALIPKHFA